MTHTTQPPRQRHRSVLMSAFIGTVLEYYDFYVYATAASLVFNVVFFPDLSPFLGMASALATYGVGYVVRPIFGLVLGHIGDKKGRRRILIFTLVGMGTMTVLIGLVPAFSTWGYAAVIILVTLRLVQGIFVSGEWGGAVTMAIENAPEGRRTLYAMFPQLGSPTGLLLANLVFFIVTSSMSESSFESFGWRIPFFLGAALIVVGLFIRLKVSETPEFSEAVDQDDIVRTPVVQIWKNHKKHLLAGILLVMAPAGPFWLINTFLPGYLKNTGEYATSTVTLIPMIVAFTQVLLSYPAAVMSDRKNPRQIAIFGALATVVLTFPVFYFAGLHVSFGLLITLIVGFAAMQTLMHIAYGALVPMQFPPAVRFSGTALIFNVGVAISGGIVPPLVALSVDILNGSMIGAAIIGSLIAFGGFVGASMMRDIRVRTGETSS